MSKNKSPNIIDFANGPAGFTQDIISTSTNISENEMVARNTNGIQFINKAIVNKSTVVKITSAQLKALFATPISVIAAPGVGYFNKIENWAVRHDAGTAYAGIAAGEDLALKYTNAAGAVAAGVIEATGFLDQATAQIRAANNIGGNIDGATPASITPVDNAAIVLHMLTGEIITGTFDLYLFINYSIIPTDFTV